MNYIVVYFELLLVISCFFLVGKILLLIVRDNFLVQQSEWFVLLKSISAGLAFTILSVSLIITKGVTLNLAAFLLLLPIVFFSYKKRNYIFSYNQILPKKELIVLFKFFFVVAVLYIFQLIKFNFFNSNTYSVPFVDTYNYSSQAAKMINLKIEGINLHSILVGSANFYRSPYHFTDLWLLGILREIFNVSYNYNYLYVYSVFNYAIAFLIVVSIWAVVNKKSNGVIFFIAILLCNLFVPKLLPIYLLSAFALIYLYNKKYRAALVFFALMPFCNILATPVCLTSIFMVACILFFKHKNREYLFCLVLCIMVAVLIIAYYKLAGDTNAGTEQHFSFLSRKYASRVYRMTIEYCTQLFYFSIPLILLIIVGFKEIIFYFKNSIAYNSITIFCIFFSLLFAVIISFNLDSHQILDMPARVLIMLITLIIISKWINNRNYSMVKGVVSLGIVVYFTFSSALSFFNDFNEAKQKLVSKKYINNIYELVNNGDVGGYIYNPKTMVVHRFAYNSYQMFSNMNYVGFINKNLSNICLSTVIDSVNLGSRTSFSYDYIKRGEFKKYIDANRNPIFQLEDYQYNFIKEKGLKYLLIDTSYSVAPAIASLVQTTIRDDLSGHTFLLLKR